MKVIDLLNKIANGEEVPKEIWCGGNRYKYNPLKQDYDSVITDNKDLLFHIGITRHLNDKITIIEEDKEIKFEGIEEYFVPQEFIEDGSGRTRDNKHSKEYRINQLIRNQRKLIDIVNELKKGK